MVWMLALCALLLAKPAAAHKASDAYLTLEVAESQPEGSLLRQRLDIHLRDLDRELDLDSNADGALSWGEVRSRWPDIQALAARGLMLSANGAPCTVQASAAPQLDHHSDGTYAVLQTQLRCLGDGAGESRLQIGYSLFERSDPGHRGVLRLRHAGQGAEQGLAAVLVPGAAPQWLPLQAAASATLGSNPTAQPDELGSSETQRFFGFLEQGVHHILIGLDHVLFLLALLLPAVLVHSKSGWQAAPALRPVVVDVLKLVTAFTLAHSITLALAVLDILNPPSRWIESIIAASVVLAALNNLKPVLGARRWLVTFAFGLVHGFGFAGALKDIGLGSGSLAVPLLGFNLGVELGQLALVALFVPLAWAWRASWAYNTAVLRGGSAAIALLAMVWLAERVFDLSLLPAV